MSEERHIRTTLEAARAMEQELARLRGAADQALEVLDGPAEPACLRAWVILHDARHPTVGFPEGFSTDPVIGDVLYQPGDR